jgi:hypothetical protein
LLLFFFGTKVEFGLGKPFLLKNPEKAREGKNNRRSEILRPVEPFVVVLAHSKRTKNGHVRVQRSFSLRFERPIVVFLNMLIISFG